MLKKLYFHTHEGRSYDFDIVATAKVDKPGFTEWIVQVDTNNELGVHEVQASTNDCTFDIVGDDSLIIWELPPVEVDDEKTSHHCSLQELILIFSVLYTCRRRK